MKQLAGEVVSWLIKHDAVEENSRELYEYAVHCLILGMAPMLYAVIIGGIMGELLTSIILILPFMITRKFSGGFHAKSEWTCLVSSCLLLYGSIMVVLRVQHGIWFNGIVLLAVGWLVFFSPIDSENRRLEKDEKKMRKKDTTIVLAIFILGYIGLLMFGKDRYAVCIGMGIILTAGLQVPCVVRIIAKKTKKMSFGVKRIEK